MCNPTVYENVLSQFRGRTTEIEVILEELINLQGSIGEDTNYEIRRILLNLRVDMNVPQEFIREVLELVHSTFTTNYVYSFYFKLKSFIERYKYICDNYYLSGRSINKSNIQYLGNAVNKDKFISRIVDANYLKVTKNQPGGIKFKSFVEREINRRIRTNNKTTLTLTSSRKFNEYVTQTSKRIMWTTWGENHDPFDFMKTRNLGEVPPQLGSPYEIALSLGLCTSILPTSNSNLLLLTYDPTNIEVHIPTVADARGNQYFSPCEEGANHGWTDTDHQDLRNFYIDCLRCSGHYTHNELSCPEGVHRPITIGCLHKIEQLDS